MQPQVSLDSDTGRSYLRLRLSRRFILSCLLALLLATVATVGTLWIAEKIWGVEKGAIGSTYTMPAGPWGTLSVQPILLEAPANLLSTNFRLGDNRWYFRANQPVEVDALLRSAGLAPEQIAQILPALQTVPELPGLLAVLPSDDLVRSLSPEVRSSLYEQLAALAENFAQVEPFRTTELHLDEWLGASTLPPDVVGQVKSLLWRRGHALLFSDYNLVADSITAPQVKLQLLRHLTRKASLVVKLPISDHVDVDPLVQYWGTGGRADKVRPLLASLAQSGGGELDISNLLPAFARQRLYRFPDPLPGSELGPGCHWSAFNFFNTGATDETLHEPAGVETLLREQYVAATGEPRFGDIILLTLPDGSSIHSAVHIADGIVFTKNGPSLATPYILSTMEDMLAFYPSSERLTLTYYRRAGT
jgi:hypothetical protein